MICPHITRYAISALLMMGLPLYAEPAGTEAELKALERELDEEQALLDQRRQELQLRKVRLELQKSGRDLPKNTELSDEEKALQLARFQAHAQAGKFRSLWMTQWKNAKDLQTPEKSERRMGSPKAFGRKAKAKEEMEERAKKLAEAQLKEFENNILTSMQTTLAEKGTLNAAELKWLESLVAVPEDEEAPPVTDEPTRRRAKLILGLTKAHKEQPEGAKSRKADPDKRGPILVE